MIEHTIPLVHILVIIAISYVAARMLLSKQRVPHFRTLEPLAAIPELIGRCVEMGRPVLFSIGGAELRTESAALAEAGFTILTEVMNYSIDGDAEVVVIVNTAEHVPLLTSIMEQAYIAKGKPDMMKSENLIFIGEGQASRISGMLGAMQKWNPGAFIFPGGAAGADSVIYGEHAARIGAMSLAGMTNIYAWPWIVSCYDYSLLGEDLLAAGAILSKDPLMMSTIWSADFYRYLLVALIVIGIVASWIGIDVTGFFQM